MFGFKLAGLTILVVMFIGNISESRADVKSVRISKHPVAGGVDGTASVNKKTEQLHILASHPVAGGVNGTSSVNKKTEQLHILASHPTPGGTNGTGGVKNTTEQATTTTNVCDESEPRWQEAFKRGFFYKEEQDYLIKNNCLNIQCKLVPKSYPPYGYLKKQMREFEERCKEYYRQQKDAMEKKN